MVLLGRLGLGIRLVFRVRVSINIILFAFHRSILARWCYSCIYGSIDSTARSIDGGAIDRCLR